MALLFIIVWFFTGPAAKGFHLSAANLVKAKKFVFAKRFQGMPKLSDIKLVEEELGQVNDGGICSTNSTKGHLLIGSFIILFHRDPL